MNKTHRIPLVITALVFVLTIAFSTVPAAGTSWVFSDEEKDTKSSREARELYKEATKLLDDGRYEKAARQYRKVYELYEKSDYAADALYWQAFSLYRLGGKSAWRDARRALEIQRDQYDRAGTKGDAEALYYRILGKLAEEGDHEAAELVAKHADDEFDNHDDADHDIDSDYDLEEKMAALHALITMKSERALPLIKKVLNDRRPGRAKLREQALFLLTQHRTSESAEMLMDIATNDPDRDVRKSAIFWLSQVDSPETAAFLERLLRESDDEEILEQAVFAFSQRKDEQSRKILRNLALDESKPIGLRENAIFWLGQSGSEEIEFLKDMYNRVGDEDLKEKILFAVSQHGGSESARWLMKIVYDEDEPMDVRKNALFWAGQQRRVDLDELVKLYKSLPSNELKEQVVFSFSQRNEKRALEIMMDLARSEKDVELRKQLIFWIGQSNDPSVEDFLLEIIND